jgi:HK97 gp10 family phage protein
MSVRRWNGEQAKRLIRAAFVRNLKAAAIVVKNRAKVLVSVPGTAKAIRKMSYRYGGLQFNVGKKGTVYGAAVSDPGEPPRKQFGRLRASIASEADAGQLRARVGTNVKYGRWLELGTSRMAARPWLRRAMDESIGQVRAILARRPPGV